ncbi:YceD family protein [Carboxydothermus ferrireducens]|uniref:DUF177 domain-containing protein n=1 Tax=Carboxydothermus ferrireducens DSM 11255 TaxID=1119529 RepID=A0ABX2REI0_9THEO|nr:DUF177 domain-containing protein [Carboxydothermus ferrireducens]NYE58223.1 uncharacterized protein [Carboxydothermus ferrireducens DSM 11255]
MYLDLTSIKNDKNVVLEFAEKINLETLGEGFGNFTSDKPFLITGTVQNTNDGFYLKGRITGEVHTNCSLCLSNIELKIDLFVERLYKLVADEDSYALVDFKINLDELVFEETVLNLPLKPVCHHDCKGLCPVCGENLNERECSCTQEEIDIRLLPLKQLLEKQKGV